MTEPAPDEPDAATTTPRPWTQWTVLWGWASIVAGGLTAALCLGGGVLLVVELNSDIDGDSKAFGYLLLMAAVGMGAALTVCTVLAWHHSGLPLRICAAVLLVGSVFGGTLGPAGLILGAIWAVIVAGWVTAPTALPLHPRAGSREPDSTPARSLP